MTKTVFVLEEGENLSGGELVFYFKAVFTSAKKAHKWVKEHYPEYTAENEIYINPDYDMWGSFSKWGLKITEYGLM